MALTRPRLGQLITNVSSLTDNITVINSAATQANVDVGFLFNRTDGIGSVPNVALYWNETLKSFTFATTTDSDSVSFANINATSWANVTAGNITANGIFWPNGQSYGASIIAAQSTYSNANVAAYLITNTGNIQAGNITTIGVSGNISNVSYILATGGVYSGNVQAGNVIVGTGLYFANGTPFSTGTASVSGLNGQLQYNNNGVLAGANVAYFSSNTTLISNATISTSGNIVSNSAIIINSTTPVTSQYSGALQVAGGTWIGGSLAVWQKAVISGNIVAGSSAPSTSTTTGALVVTGGAGIAGDVNIGGNTNVTGNIQAGNVTILGNLTVANIIYTNQEIITSTETVQGNLVIGSTVASVDTTTGAIVVIGGAGIGGNLNVGTAQSVHHISGNLNIGPYNVNRYSGGDTVAFTINLSPDVPQFSNSAIQYSGGNGRGISQTMDSFGNSVSNGSVLSLRRARGTTNSPTALLSGDQIGGMVGHGYGATGYYTSGTLSTSAGFGIYAAETHTDTAQGTFLSLRTTANGSLLATEAVRIDSNGNVVIVANTASTSNVTGALVVNGGIGVSGNIYGNSRVGFVYANSVSSVYTTFNQATASYDIVFG